MTENYLEKRKMKVKVFRLNSFTNTPEGGNPAGVVLDAKGLSEEQMLSTAQAVGFSETAFVTESNKADFKVRFFTPTDEVDICGHATIATFSFMHTNHQIKNVNYTQETKAGILGIEIQNDGTVFMSQNAPEYFEELDKTEIADSLNIPPEYLDNELPIQIVSTGARDIFIPIKSLHYLSEIKPDMEKIANICKKHTAISYHIFTLDLLQKSTAHCRNFAPLYGIPEDSATGISTGALACYLFKHGKIENSQLSKLVFEQGESMGKPSEILVKLVVSDEEIKEVKVGGKAIISKELEIEV